MPFYVQNMILKELSRIGKNYTNAKILFLGVAFKRDVDDTRHSPALKVMELLVKAGVQNISYNDPFVPSVVVAGSAFSSVALTPKGLRNADIVVITTDHTSYDYPMIVKNSRCIVDSRNATKGIPTMETPIRVLGSGE